MTKNEKILLKDFVHNASDIIDHYVSELEANQQFKEYNEVVVNLLYDILGYIWLSNYGYNTEEIFKENPGMKDYYKKWMSEYRLKTRKKTVK